MSHGCPHRNTYHETFLGREESWTGVVCRDCTFVLKRINSLDAISKDSTWFESFKEYWNYWKFAKPNTEVGDKETNNHLIRTGYVIPSQGLK